MLRQDGVTITELDSISSNIAANSVLPIVEIQSDTTYKTSVELLANFILNSIIPNVTLNLGNANVANLNSTNSNLGSVSNVTILGGSNGYVLTTDGSGNLTWAFMNTDITGDGGNAASSLLLSASLNGGNATNS